MVHRVKEANDSGSVRPDNLQVSCLCLAVDDLPGSDPPRIVNADVIFAIDFEICFLKRLKVKSLVLHLTGLFQKFDLSGRLTFQSSVRTLYNKKLPNEEKSDIKTYQNTQIYYERKTSSEDFHEVQMTSRKSRRLPGSRLEDFLKVVWKTSWKSSSALYFRRLTCKSSQKSSRSEKKAYQIQILKICISKNLQMT
ncbi:hypothetical protein IGI04_022910 [Brassica rapa subsp. trilocularis]|uniref:Uncharacterized protein n=1 Tax=Brassica rapa subsp. trilocularis TaxID=1813537 RepID=A0ABQ7M2C2_BRACM|nr:hypothetical protein IGI04_022910 [Brassica rapa subsp. trilocularis]